MKDKACILVIDDEPNMRHMLDAMLAGHGYTTVQASNGVEGLEAVKQRIFHFVLCDVRMPEMDGMAFLQAAKDYLGDATVIMMSAYGTIDLAIEAMKLGAYDFISKPFKSDEVLLTLKKAEERQRLQEENRKLRKLLDEGKGGFGRIIGKSDAIRKSIEVAQKAAPYASTVLITGESGTGKELMARGIHAHSPLSSQPFWVVNCGSIPADLLESELFGYAKGAFTGAEQSKKGLFDLANGSTLFLDEIGELPGPMQVKLLRVLQEGEIRPLGASATKTVKVRILAATAKDLQKEVAQGRFRGDLFYRLNVIHLEVPPLRERSGDIPLICEHFLKKLSLKLQKDVKKISPNALNRLVDYPWPGNVRELENVLERGCVLAEGSVLRSRHLPDSILGRDKACTQAEFFPSFSLKQGKVVMEKWLISRALEEAGGNKSRAAELLEASYPSLLAKIKEYQLDSTGKKKPY